MINASHFPPREIQTTTILAKFKKASSCMKYPLSRFVDILQALMPLSAREQSPSYKEAISRVVL